jgi:hypothetical protein
MREWESGESGRVCTYSFFLVCTLSEVEGLSSFFLICTLSEVEGLSSFFLVCTLSEVEGLFSFFLVCTLSEVEGLSSFFLVCTLSEVEGLSPSSFFSLPSSFSLRMLIFPANLGEDDRPHTPNANHKIVHWNIPP